MENHDEFKHIIHDADAADLHHVTKGMASNDTTDLLTVVCGLCRVVSDQQRQIDNLRDEIEEKSKWSC